MELVYDWFPSTVSCYCCQHNTERQTRVWTDESNETHRLDVYRCMNPSCRYQWEKRDR